MAINFFKQTTRSNFSSLPLVRYYFEVLLGKGPAAAKLRVGIELILK